MAAPLTVGRLGEDPVSVRVELGQVSERTDPFALGIGCSTYGATPLSNDEQATQERRLDARTVRVPVGWRNGQLTSSATGGPMDLDATALVDTYRSWGYRVLVVLGGRTTDGDLAAGDVARTVRVLGTDMVEYSAPNEPDSAGGVEAALAAAVAMHEEGARVAPGFRLWGPAWSHYEPNALEAFAHGMGQRLAGLDYHHYGMGEHAIGTAEVLRDTPVWGREVRHLKAQLRTNGLPETVSVDELNLSWRYVDGSRPRQGGWLDPVNGKLSNRRFFTAVNTVFLASVCGHVLSAGGRALPYATQDRALGMTVQPEYDGNPDRRPPQSPMPGYWGIAAWTGAGSFPHFAERFFEVTKDDDDPLLEVFAVDNEAGGVNVVVVSKHETAERNIRVRVTGASDARADCFRTDRARPYAPLHRAFTQRPHRDGLSVTAAPMTVTVLVLS